MMSLFVINELENIISLRETVYASAIHLFHLNVYSVVKANIFHIFCYCIRMYLKRSAVYTKAIVQTEYDTVKENARVFYIHLCTVPKEWVCGRRSISARNKLIHQGNNFDSPS